MLKNLHIASPCSAEWPQMQGDNQVRHCTECNLNVYNFTEMTAREVKELIASREGRVCARFYRRADGTILTRDCPVGLWLRVRRASRAVGAALSAALCIPFAMAQSSRPGAPQTLVQIDPGAGGILVKVLDSAGARYSHAEIQLMDASGRQVSHGTTDAKGQLRLLELAPGSYTMLVYGAGFEPNRRTVVVKSQKLESLEMILEPRMLMGDVAEVPQPVK